MGPRSIIQAMELIPGHVQGTQSYGPSYLSGRWKYPGLQRLINDFCLGSSHIYKTQFDEGGGGGGGGTRCQPQSLCKGCFSSKDDFTCVSYGH